MTVKLIIHGGAGAREGDHAGAVAYDEAVREVVAASYNVLAQDGARAAVVDAIRRMEDNPLFNAGTGSRLQSDGAARMSAALMDSANLSLSAIINIENVRNPITVVDALSGARHPMLASDEAGDYARSIGVPEHDVVTQHRIDELNQGQRGKTGTVGAVALDATGLLCAGTSTGGVGNETPGRISDSATVAGTYVSASTGVSCTGIGEDIVNQAVAARLITRVDDGLTLDASAERTIAEGTAAGYQYGLIALGADGRHYAGETIGVTTVYAMMDEDGIETFLQTTAQMHPA
jgi:L-asparaginase